MDLDLKTDEDALVKSVKTKLGGPNMPGDTLKLRGKANLLENSTRVNIEADSLNAAVLAPDVDPDGDNLTLSVVEPLPPGLTADKGPW